MSGKNIVILYGRPGLLKRRLHLTIYSTAMKKQYKALFNALFEYLGLAQREHK